MGTACIANAARCGRLHCTITGPLFLFASAATVLGELGIIRAPAPGILAALVLGTALGYGLEWVRGKYITAKGIFGR